MKILKTLFITLISIIVLLALVVFGAYFFVRAQYGIDLFRTAGQLSALNEPVNEATLCSNLLVDGDLQELQTTLNAQFGDGFITYAENTGYKGYTVNLSALANPAVLAGLTSVQLSEKQTGALGQILFFEETSGKIDVGDKQLETTITQIDFSNIDASGNADFNIIVKIDLTPLKDEMKGFPYSWFKGCVPDSLYVSSTVRIEKTAAKMGYTVAHKELKVNNLSASDTADLFHTLDTVLKIGTAESLNTTIGTEVTNVLIGNSSNAGFAYSLSIVFDTFNFKTIETADYFVIE